MTQEEKARAYDEAIGKAQDIFHTSEFIKITDLFPDLAENEDERMWKLIKKYAHYNISDIALNADHITRKELEDWLEKQKESAIKWMKSDNVKNPDKPYIDKAGMFYTTDGRMCYASEIEKQKVQKPVEKPVNWTELTWKDINDLERIINNVHYEFRNGIGEKSFGEEVLERFRNEKDDAEVDACELKQEWSEEDEKFAYFVNQFLGYHENADPTAMSCKKWFNNRLKSLRPQPKPEWSEEDSDVLLQTAAILKANFDSDEKFEDCDYDCETLAGKLLEMRYRISPS